MLAPLVAIALQQRTLHVFAAASLKDSFTAISRAFEAAHRGVHVALSFGGSQTLAAQINHGAPADVFASAAGKNLQSVAYDKSTYRVFALNKLTVAVRKGLGIRTLADLPKARAFVVADPAVPVGAYTETFLSKAAKTFGSSWLASVRSHVVSREQDVKAVLAKVKLGEGDAGVVYVSDVRAAKGGVDEVPIPDSMNVVAEYPAAMLTAAQDKPDARVFLKVLLEPEAQKALAAQGFAPPAKAKRKGK